MFVCARMIRACSCSVTNGLITGWYFSQCNEYFHLFGWSLSFLFLVHDNCQRPMVCNHASESGPVSQEAFFSQVFMHIESVSVRCSWVSSYRAFDHLSSQRQELETHRGCRRDCAGAIRWGRTLRLSLPWAIWETFTGLGIGGFILFGYVLWACAHVSIVQSGNGVHVRSLFLSYKLENYQGPSAVSRSAIVFFTCPVRPELVGSGWIRLRLQVPLWQFDIPYSAASVVCDVLISGSCLFYLRPGRNGVQQYVSICFSTRHPTQITSSSNNYLQGLLVVTLQMGVLTSYVSFHC